MPLNLIKTYPELLEIAFLTESQRRESLTRIFTRDIVENLALKFIGKQIRPLKIDGQTTMQVLYHHLTTKEDEDEKGKKVGTRSFELARSVRIHWIKIHLEETARCKIDVFSYLDRVKDRDVVRTYIYDMTQEYVVILEPQRSGRDYYLLTAYHLNQPGGKRQIEKKQKKKLASVH